MILKEFDTTYTKRGKHRKKCRDCGRLIQDGERVNVRQIRTEKYYPVKGIMHFTSYQYRHFDCGGLS